MFWIMQGWAEGLLYWVSQDEVGTSSMRVLISRAASKKRARGESR